jgi:hypothetical protein
MYTCSFTNLHRFQTPVQKFAFGVLKFEFETETAEIKYRICLAKTLEWTELEMMMSFVWCANTDTRSL